MSGTLAVGFDFDHTLGLDNGLETTAFYRLGAALGHSLSERDTEWSSTIAAALHEFRAGLITLDDAVARFVTRLELDSPKDCGTQYREICYSLVDELVTPIDGAHEIVAALAQRDIPTAILTNGWSPLQSLKIARALDYSGTILVSDSIGVLKPHPAAFAALVDTLGVAPERIWFVGDNPTTDILGAQAAGMHGVWFDWENLAYPADAPHPEFHIRHLNELLDVLRGSVI